MGGARLGVVGSTPARRRDGALVEVALRGIALLTYGVLVWNVARHWWMDTSRVTLLLLLVTETFTLGLVLFARRASLRDASPMAVAATVYAAFFFVLFRYDTQRLAPEWVGATLQFAGLAWQVSAKAVLGRAFGLLPAARGLVTAGPYRVVRHPIYLGYLLSHIGFLVGNFAPQNLAVLAALYLAQIVRMAREESTLAADDPQGRYADYRARVRYRLIPFVY